MSKDKFEWTDSKVLDFIGYSGLDWGNSNVRPLFEKQLEQFKQEQLNKEWWFVRIKTPTHEEPIGYFGRYEGSEEYRSKEGAYAWFNDKESAIKLSNELKKQPLFTTEDGVDIFEGGECWMVEIIDGRISNRAIHWTKITKDGIRNYERYFSTEAAAEEYIIENKPCLSVNNIRSIDVLRDGVHAIESLKQLAKDKLGKK